MGRVLNTEVGKCKELKSERQLILESEDSNILGKRSQSYAEQTDLESRIRFCVLRTSFCHLEHRDRRGFLDV